MIAEQMRTLSEISRKKKIPVIITNQVYFDFLSEEEAVEIVKIFLETKFPIKGREERDMRRMEKIKKIEEND